MEHTSETVVIVEDEPDLAALLVDIVDSAGYRSVLTSGTHAVDVIREASPAVVVLDYRMPGVDGEQVVSRLRAEGGAPGAALLLVSGDEAVAEIADRIKVDAYLRKPFDVDRFLAVIGRLASARGSGGDSR